jgi:acetoin utilization deacetylase AcuC-like enzyme
MDIIYTDRHHLHATENLIVHDGPFVIEETPPRIEIILKAVQAAGLGPVISPTDHGLAPILAVHQPDYVDYLRRAYRESAEFYDKAEPVAPGTFAPRGFRRQTRHIYGQSGYYSFGVGAPIVEHTWTAAYWSAQCALTAADRLLAGERAAYALCRPPGHHAAADLSGGFCYLNNAAIAARYLQTQATASIHPTTLSPSTKKPGGVGGGSNVKVAILDIDYHHGNGTQEIFYTDPGVFFCSLHAHPDDDYPFFWGDSNETGEGSGAGCNLNLPLPQGAQDDLYLAVLDKGILAIRSYAPHYLVISAGLDTVAGDPVGGFNLTRAGLAAVGQRIAMLGLPTLLVQEGGYLLETLGENAMAILTPFGATAHQP